MLIRTKNKKEVYRDLINLALQDPRVYCNACGKEHPSKLRIVPCCDTPQVGTNLDHTRAVIKQVKEIKESRRNDFASNQSKTMRWGVSMPHWMYQVLNEYESRYGEGRKLFKTNDDINWFAKNFPQFAIPKVI